MGLTLDFEWIDPGEAKGPELRATWASLQISLNGSVITRLIDNTSRSVRNNLFLPLYPLAEWIATHWWFFFHEVEAPGRSASIQYEKRHNLRYGAEGFALPSLIIQPLGEQIRLDWRPVRLPAQNLEITASGSGHVLSAELRETLSDFINAVLRRLQEHGIEGTLLEAEWNNLQTADDSEVEFCSTVASLGLDPYSLDEQRQQEVINVGNSLPPSLWPDFFSAADAGSLREQADKVLGALELSCANRTNLEPLKTLRREMSAAAMVHYDSPWQQGYDFAHQLRSRLHLNGDKLRSFASLGDALGVPGSELESAIVLILLPGSFNAVIATNSFMSPVLAMPKRPDVTIRFAFCRALFEYLTSSEDDPLLLTAARSERQKRNRAFAAEFLAPADLLRKELSSRLVGDEEIDDLAVSFGVSSTVIRHQIVNHGLALALPD